MKFRGIITTPIQNTPLKPVIIIIILYTLLYIAFSFCRYLFFIFIIVYNGIQKQWLQSC